MDAVASWMAYPPHRRFLNLDSSFRVMQGLKESDGARSVFDLDRAGLRKRTLPQID